MCAAGCGGAQGGKFANTSNRESTIVPNVGFILIARGAPLRHSAVTGPEANLLYVLVVCPGMQGELTGTRSNIGRFTSDYWHSWSTPLGEVSLSFIWDRVADTVHLAASDYQREHGNAFIVRRDPTVGTWRAQQLSSIDPQLSAAEALREIQFQAADDPAITSLAIYPGA